MLIVAYRSDHIVVHRDGDHTGLAGVEHRAQHIHRHAVSQVQHPVLGNVVGLDEHGLCVRIRGDSGDVTPVVSAGDGRERRRGQRRGRGRRSRRGLRRHGRAGRGEDGGKAVVVPIHRGSQLLRDKAQGHHGALQAVPFDHACGHAAGQLHGLPVDQGGGGAQSKHNIPTGLEDEHLPGIGHPGHRCAQLFRDETYRHQRAAVTPQILDERGDAVGRQGRPVEGEGHQIGLSQRPIRAGGLLIKIDVDPSRGPCRLSSRDQQGEKHRRKQQDRKTFPHDRLPLLQTKCL